MYDQAETPLQRLLLSEVLPAAQEHALRERFQALDPVRLLGQPKTATGALHSFDERFATPQRGHPMSLSSDFRS